MIKPTIGRIVLFTPVGAKPEDQKWPGIITFVHSDTCVNLAVFDPSGGAYSRTSVKLLQEDEAIPQSDQYCEWMPYQKGQAAKTEALEKEIQTAKIQKVEPATTIYQEPVGTRTRENSKDGEIDPL